MSVSSTTTSVRNRAGTSRRSKRSRPAHNDRLFPGDASVGYAILIVFSLATVIPLAYMISLAFQSDSEAFAGDPVLWPHRLRFDNFARLFDAAPFGRFLLNSIVMTVAITASQLLIAPIAGYAFAKFTFPFKRTIFIVVLSTMMIPFFVRMIPTFVIFSQIGWLNTYQALIVPYMVSAFGIFLMRQFIEPLPDALIEAARVDGASELRIYWGIVLPQVKPALGVLALFTFITHWNEFLWPLIASSSETMRTMPVGLTLFNTEYFTQWNLTAAGALLLFIPTVVIFLFTQRYLVRGIALTGLK